MSIEIRQLCWLQQQECGERGHASPVWARRIASNGATFVKRACSECGQTLGAAAKSKDHPRRDTYPTIVVHRGECSCVLCDERRAAGQAFRERMDAQRAVVAQTADGRSQHIGNAEWAAYLASDEWRSRRTACHERYGYRCAICNRSDELQAHHRTYERVTREAPTDLISLCRGCHELFHFGRPTP